MTTLKWRSLVVILLASILVTRGGHADDLLGMFEKDRDLDKKVIEKLTEIDHFRSVISRRAQDNKDNKGLEGVVEKFLLWPSGGITVCFMDGSKDQTREVAAVASRWTDGTSVYFDFGDQESPQTCEISVPSSIRITFKGHGSWSEVGTKARFIPEDHPTMQLGGLGPNALDAGQVGEVLHEFGHALGFEHEHKNPQGGCEAEYDWDFLYATLPYPKQQVDSNMRELDKDSRITGVYSTPFDQDSIMNYKLPKEAFLIHEKSKCYIGGERNKLSKTDQDVVRALYNSN
jgi:hypothetical protein